MNTNFVKKTIDNEYTLLIQNKRAKVRVKFCKRIRNYRIIWGNDDVGTLSYE